VALYVDMLYVQANYKAVSIHWTGLLDWTTGLDYWTDLYPLNLAIPVRFLNPGWALFFFLFSFAVVVVVVLVFFPLGGTENKDLSLFLYQCMPLILFVWPCCS